MELRRKMAAYLLMTLSSVLLLGSCMASRAAPNEVSSPLLISEILYDTPGTDSDEEWIEIYNNTSSALDISGYKLGDEETQGGSEGMFEFPQDTIVQAGAKVTVSLKATGFYTLYAKNPDFEIIDTSPVVPNMIKHSSWATGNTIALANDGDEMILLGGTNEIIDVVTYENSSYPGVVPHSGVSSGHSLERFPADQDTGDCSIDFTEQANPNPETSISQDITGPNISNLQPINNSTVNNTRPAINADYSDSGGAGIDPATARLYLDGVDKTSEATVTENSIMYAPSALTQGEHSVKVEVRDKSGNLSEAQWTFTVVQARLSLLMQKVYWASYQDYLNRELSIEYKLSNVGNGDALNTQINGITATNGVISIASKPIDLGIIGTGSTKTFTVKYTVPAGTARFRTTIHATCEDDGGIVTHY